MNTEQENIRFDLMAQELESIKDEVSEMKTMLKDIHTLLAGNPIDKEASGLLYDLKKMKSELDFVKDELNKYRSYFFAIVTLFGLGVLKIIIDILKDGKI